MVCLFASVSLVGCSKAKPQSGGQTADKISLKFCWTTADSEDDPYAISAHVFKDIIEKKSQGRVEVKLYPNGQLGGERDVLEGLSLGTVDLSMITNAYVSGIIPQFQALDLPFIFKDKEQAYKVLDGEFGQNLLKRLEARGVKGLGFAEGGFRHMINNVRPIKTPEDVEGIKFRVMESPIYIGMFKALGSNSTPMAWGEVFTAVQQKTIDGLEIPVSVMHQNKYYEVTKYLSLTNHTYSPIIYMMSLKTFNKLPPDIQQLVLDTVKEAVPMERAKNVSNTEKLLADLKAKGMQINEINDPKAFQNKVRPMYAQFESVIGKDVLDALFAATK